MFINRPDQMNEGSPHNLAKLAIAKHRNGPTHSGLDLVFIENSLCSVNAILGLIWVKKMNDLFYQLSGR